MKWKVRVGQDSKTMCILTSAYSQKGLCGEGGSKFRGLQMARNLVWSSQGGRYFVQTEAGTEFS